MRRVGDKFVRQECFLVRNPGNAELTYTLEYDESTFKEFSIFKPSKQGVVLCCFKIC